MHITMKSDLNNFSFIHFDIINVAINTTLKKIIFRLKGANYFNDNKQCELGQGYFEISNYDRLTISSYHAKSKTEKSLTEADALNLNELCEIEVFDEKIIVKGFEDKSNNWLEYSIIGGTISGQFEEAITKIV